MATMIDAIYYPDRTNECERPLFMIPVEAGFLGIDLHLEGLRRRMR